MTISQLIESLIATRTVRGDLMVFTMDQMDDYCEPEVIVRDAKRNTYGPPVAVGESWVTIL